MSMNGQYAGKRHDQAMKKTLLAAFAAVCLSAAPALATTFVKDVMLIGGTTSETTAQKDSLTSQG